MIENMELKNIMINLRSGIKSARLNSVSINAKTYVSKGGTKRKNGKWAITDWAEVLQKETRCSVGETAYEPKVQCCC